jgi:GH15 family glucan-1,4-alpha-glucosidase
MPSRIEDYALIGDLETAALVGRDGSIDWLCLPRFDSPACFAALLGTPDHGRWQIAPAGAVRAVRRRYRPDTLILETEFETAEGVVALIDCMPLRPGPAEIVRVVEGRRGRVPMRMDLAIRFDYGTRVPWVRKADEGGIRAIAGPDALRILTPVALTGQNLRHVAAFEVAAGDRVPFVAAWYPSHEPEPAVLDAMEAIAATERFWTQWCITCTDGGEWRDAIARSLITLKALTYAPTGGLVAAVTTSLPEQIGGVRNWDYRFCWLRDATSALYALVEGGYVGEARAWREWLLRAVAGAPAQAQIMYGLAGERRLTERELDLPGYEDSRPVRIGNAAHAQFQLDVYGEVLDTLHAALCAGLAPDENAWRVERELVEFVATAWQEPDEGIWEVRGPRRHFTHSKVMAWVAMDRAVKGVEHFGLPGDAARWARCRDAIHADVCARGFNPAIGAFVQSYDGSLLDASLLMIPLVGFLPAHDPRVLGTVKAIETRLMDDGLVRRYETEPDVDGLPPGEGAFLLCTFWLADNLTLQDRRDDARAIFERLLSLRNDVGLLSEQYDCRRQRQVGNFPQAFSHVGLINTARNLSRRDGPAEHRRHS